MPPMAAALGSSSPLDMPPPSPQSMGGGPTGAPTPFSLDAIAPGTVPANQLPPEILQSILQSAQRIGAMFDSYAQVMPDLADQWGLLKDQLQTLLAQVMTAGAPPISPTASGQQFPAGGLDRGISGAGAI